MSNVRWFKVDPRAAVAMHRRGMPVTQIAREFECTRASVHRVLNRMYAKEGLPEFLHPQPPAAQHWPRVSEVLATVFGDLPRTPAVEAAAERGTRIHDALRSHLSGIAVDVSEDDEPVLRGALAALAEITPVDSQVLAEMPVWDISAQVRGTADVVIWTPQPKYSAGVTVIDLKTGSQTKRNLIQMAAYVSCLRDMTRSAGINATVSGFLLYVDREGQFRFVKAGTDEHVDVWRACLTIHGWLGG